MPNKKTSTYDHYVRIDTFEIFDGNDLSSVVKSLDAICKKYDDPVKFKVMKSEFGMGEVVYLHVQVPDDYVEEKTQEKKKKLSKALKKMIKADKKEFVALRNKQEL